MSSYRPNYSDHSRLHHDIPPPPPSSDFKPPLPYGPPPPYEPYELHASSHQQPIHYDSWRPSNGSDRQSDFTFRNDAHAPQYPQEQAYLRPRHSADYARRPITRQRPAQGRREEGNINAARRGRYQFGKYNRPAPSERPLLRHHDNAVDSSEQVLGMMIGSAAAGRFLPAEDVSDSEEEQMQESESEGARSDVNDADHGPIVEGTLEPPLKRRALAKSSSDADNGLSEPKWSNPDPYTVLPPIDESHRKKRDVVKLIRKARKEAKVVGAERSQAAANDDFISFVVDEETPDVVQDIPPIPKAGWSGHRELGVPGAPTGPRQFSHLENLHRKGAPGKSETVVTAGSLGPPPGLPLASSISSPPSRPALPEKVILDTALPAARVSARADVAASDRDEDGALGSRKRTHDDRIRYIGRDSLGKPSRPGKNARVSGSIVEDWIPGPGIDPIPWVRRADKQTATAGFRLHKEICDFYEFVRPQGFEQIVREELLARLQSVVSREIPHCEVHCFGSFAAGLYLPTADMDVVIISGSFRSSRLKVVCQTKNQMHKLGRFLEYSKLARAGSVEVIPNAKVPIIKFVDRLTGIKIDVSFENDTGIVANETFAVWKRHFPAMPVLVTVIKQFLMMRGLNEVQFGGLGGFSVTCLVISLLHNMPRVQTGELIPEEHLGEMLIEFLDFYGNNLDTTRTGLVMDPPGYFDKVSDDVDDYEIPLNHRQQAYERSYLKARVYNASKADRLAIVDPNNTANDISGGSSEVMRIFDRFSKAHVEILAAMKASDRPSLLDWSLGGNYESFARQRNHLLALYEERNESLAGVTDQYRQVTQTESLPVPKPKDVPLKSVAIKRNPKSSNQDAGKNAVKSVTIAEIQGAAARRSRARSLHKQYPDMKNIPLEVSKEQKKSLVKRYKGSNVVGSNGVHVTANAGNQNRAPLPRRATFKDGRSKKHSERAARVKQNYPIVTGLTPDKIETHRSRAKLDEKLASPSSPHPTARVSMPVPADLPRRPQPHAPTQGTYSTRHHAALRSTPKGTLENASALLSMPNGSFKNPNARTSGLSKKMAPLTDERRAEVIRNFRGLSHDDPINLD